VAVERPSAGAAAVAVVLADACMVVVFTMMLRMAARGR
jgi:hypothetical protein